MAAPLTEAAIEKLRDLIASGALLAGTRLPPEAELATPLGASRNTVREAARALVTARMLDVRRILEPAATALVHVATTEAWMRRVLGERPQTVNGAGERKRVHRTRICGPAA